MTSVELLERAAASLRERATAVPQGFWTPRDGWEYGGTSHATRIANEGENRTVLGAERDELFGDTATFELIVLLASPPVALALADWLDAAAHHAWHMGSGGAALAVARAILREEP